MKTQKFIAKRQIQHLIVYLHHIYTEKMSSLDQLTPEFCLNTSELEYRYIPFSPKRYNRWSAYDDIIQKLPTLVGKEDDLSCFRALTLLTTWSDHHFGEAETLEKLFSFVTSSTEPNFVSSLQFLDVLARSGYEPENYSLFIDWTTRLASQVMASTLLSKAKKTEAALHLSLSGIFLPDMLDVIFSLEFLHGLESELNDCSTERAKNSIIWNLAHLNRNVCIECPHLNTVWFGQNIFQALNESNRHYSFNNKQIKLLNSLRRICEDEKCVQTNELSPYEHPIDFLITFNSASLPVVPHTEGNEEKVVVKLLTQKDLCHASKELNGAAQMEVRQLEILGYSVAKIYEDSLFSMDLHSNERLDMEVKRKINSSVWFALPWHS